MTRERVIIHGINPEGVKLIAKLGAADQATLRRAIEDFRLGRLPGRWSKYDMINYIVSYCTATTPTEDQSRMQDTLVHHGLWAGAKSFRRE